MAGMKASFDGARLNLANAFNRLVEADSKFSREAALEEMNNVRSAIVGLLCMYDDTEPDDARCLVEEVTLLEVEGYEI